MIETPILDGEQPLPTRKTRWVPALLAGFAIGGLLIALDRARGSPSPLIPPRGFPIFVLAFYIAIFVHELGHLFGAMTAGFELRTFMVGAFLFTREVKGWRLRLLPRNLFWGGLTGGIPRSVEDLSNRHMRFVLGGPAASFGLLIITLLLPAGLTTRILFWTNLLLVLSVSIPYTVVTLPNDAKLILLLARKGAVGERLNAILYLLALDAQGKQPREWPPELIEKLAVPTEDVSRMPTALGLLLSDAADREDTRRTAEILERALAMNNKMLPDLRRGFLAAAAGYHGFLRGDAVRAEAWLKQARQVKGGVRRKDWDSKALAAVFFAKGEHAESAESLTRYLAFLDRLPKGGMSAAERERTWALFNTITSPPKSGLSLLDRPGV